jgi:thiamine-phosphate pyrophosphorylase
VLDRSVLRGELLHALAAAVGAGVDRVQLRERNLEGAALLELADAVCRTARDAAAGAGRGVEVVVNRRLDVALAAGADGAHLGFDALPLAEARALLGPRALLGVSCHSPEEVGAAEGADYAHLAPVFAPLSKTGARPALGLEALERAARRRPVLAQGGVEASNAAACLAAGAAGVAVTGAILMAADPGRAAARLRRALDAAA